MRKMMRKEASAKEDATRKLWPFAKGMEKD
jgi:hypothetical protein